MNHDIIRKQRFILARTEADLRNTLAEDGIVGNDIVFVAEPGNKDIYTHGVFMLEEIKRDVSDLKIMVGDHEKRISSLEKRVTNIELVIENINEEITNLHTDITNIENNFNKKIDSINQRITNITNTAVTIKVTNSLPAISEADDHTIYLVASSITGVNNKYVEYILQNGQWEKLGEQAADLNLSDYYTKSEIDVKLGQKADKEHTHTISEITDFPTFKTINGQSITGSGDITIDASGSTSEYWKLEGTTLSPINSDHEVSAKTFYATSDRNTKKDIHSISDEDVEKVNNVEFVSYKFKNDDKLRYGVIAQQVEEAGLSHLVSDGQVKQVDYISLLMLEIYSLKNQINELNNKINEYEKTSNKK